MSGKCTVTRYATIMYQYNLYCIFCLPDQVPGTLSLNKTHKSKFRNIIN